MNGEKGKLWQLGTLMPTKREKKNPFSLFIGLSKESERLCVCVCANAGKR